MTREWTPRDGGIAYDAEDGYLSVEHLGDGWGWTIWGMTSGTYEVPPDAYEIAEGFEPTLVAAMAACELRADELEEENRKLEAALSSEYLDEPATRSVAPRAMVRRASLPGLRQRGMWAILRGLVRRG